MEESATGGVWVSSCMKCLLVSTSCFYSMTHKYDQIQGFTYLSAQDFVNEAKTFDVMLSSFTLSQTDSITVMSYCCMTCCNFFNSCEVGANNVFP